MKAETGKKNEKWMFVRIWLRVGGPVLSVTAIVLYFLLYMVLISIESLGGSRVERISAETGMMLSNTDLTDREAVERQLDRLADFHMAGILFDGNGREIARSAVEHYADADNERIAQYHKMEEMMLERHAGSGRSNEQVNVFDYNYWFAEAPVWIPQGACALYCAGMTSSWQRDGDKLILMGAVFFAAMFVLTLFIAGSYHKLYKKRRAMEADYSGKVNALAHGLKTPMMVISGYSENFLAEIQVEKREHYAEKILENVSKMNGIVEEMLEFTASRSVFPG